MSREKIIVDVDDVLFNSAQGFTNFSNSRWGTNFKLEDYDENWGQWWGVDADELKHRNDVIWGEAVPDAFELVTGARAGLARLAMHGALYVLTSRPTFTKSVTQGTIEREFPGLFQDVLFAGFYDDFANRNAHRLTKAELVQKLGGTHLVDDLPKHCNGTAAIDIPAILFGDYHWQQGVDLHPVVSRGVDWEATGDYFDARAAA